MHPVQELKLTPNEPVVDELIPVQCIRAGNTCPSQEEIYPPRPNIFKIKT
jgi:hypothetical protein